MDSISIFKDLAIIIIMAKGWYHCKKIEGTTGCR